MLSRLRRSCGHLEGGFLLLCFRPSGRRYSTSCETTPVVVPAAHVPSTSRVLDTIKRAHVEEIANEESGDEERENARINPKRESANLPRVV
jgi:hypothetical protein